MNTPESENALTRLKWPLIVVALLAGHAVLMMVAVTLALASPPAGIPDDYYGAALDWDARQAARRTSEALGWRVAIAPSVVTNPLGARRVSIELVDAAGRPVEGASLSARAYHHAKASRVVEQSDWYEAAPGVYVAELRMPRAGLWEFALRAQRGPDAFVHDQTVRIWPVTPTAAGGQGGGG